MTDNASRDLIRETLLKAAADGAGASPLPVEEADSLAAAVDEALFGFQAGIRELHVVGGTITADFEPPGWVVPKLAQALADWLGDAPNYAESLMQIKRSGSFERYTLTVQRLSGRTPHELRMTAESERNHLRELLQGMFTYGAGHHHFDCALARDERETGGGSPCNCGYAEWFKAVCAATSEQAPAPSGTILS